MLILLKQSLFSIKSILIITVVTLIYVFLPVYALNYRFAINMLTSNISLIQKINVLYIMLWGLFTAFTMLDIVLLLLTGILVGINIVLLIKTTKRMKETTSPLKITVGGGGLIGLFSSGCAGCGLSFASVFGVTTSFTFLPYGNKLLYFIAIAISLYSIIFMLHKLKSSAAGCKVR